MRASCATENELRASAEEDEGVRRQSAEDLGSSVNGGIHDRVVFGISHHDRFANGGIKQIGVFPQIVYVLTYLAVREPVLADQSRIPEHTSGFVQNVL
jgi:hypothetical protein